MDFISHIMFSWLILVGHEGIKYYTIYFGVLMGMFPDLDVLLMPLGRFIKRENPFLYHRGFSHSLLFLPIYVCTSALVWMQLFPDKNLELWMLIVVGLAAGGFHLTMDLISNYGVYILYPWKNRAYKLNIERGVNIYVLMAGSSMLLFFYYLHEVKDPYVKYPDLLPYAQLFLSVFFAYLMIRVVMKLYTAKRYREEGYVIRALPTNSPFSWLVLKTKDSPKGYDIWFFKKSYLSNRLEEQVHFSFKRSGKKALFPLEGRDNVLEYTQSLSEVRNYFGRLSFPVAKIRELDGSPWSWEVFWYPVEFVSGTRVWAVRVRVALDGSYKSGFKLIHLNND